MTAQELIAHHVRRATKALTHRDAVAAHGVHQRMLASADFVTRRETLREELGGISGDFVDLRTDTRDSPLGPNALRQIGAVLNRIDKALRAAGVDPQEAMAMSATRQARQLRAWGA